jgi:hypothetical protein
MSDSGLSSYNALTLVGGFSERGGLSNLGKHNLPRVSQKAKLTAGHRDWNLSTTVPAERCPSYRAQSWK